MKEPTKEQVEEFQRFEKENKHLRSPFGGCKVCGGGYWHKRNCEEINKGDKK